jgi:hypothetical protein
MNAVNPQGASFNAFAYPAQPIPNRIKQKHLIQEAVPSFTKMAPRAVASSTSFDTALVEPLPLPEYGSEYSHLSGTTQENALMINGQRFVPATFPGQGALGNSVVMNGHTFIPQSQDQKRHPLSSRQETVQKLVEKKWYERIGIQALAWTTAIFASAFAMNKIGSTKAVRAAVDNPNGWVKWPAKAALCFADVIAQLGIVELIEGIAVLF